MQRGILLPIEKENAMIIDTNDDRRLEVIRCPNSRLFLCIEDQHGSQETIILDKDQATRLQSYITEAVGEMRCE